MIDIVIDYEIKIEDEFIVVILGVWDRNREIKDKVFVVWVGYGDVFVVEWFFRNDVFG